MNLVEDSSKLHIYLSANLLLLRTRNSEKLIVLLKLRCMALLSQQIAEYSGALMEHAIDQQSCINNTLHTVLIGVLNPSAFN